jgi:uncharacterized membrane protein
VLVLHLPIGILLLAALLEVLSWRPRFRALDAAMPLMWLLGAVSAVVTVVLGYMHAAEGGFQGNVIDLHRWSGSLVALFAFTIWAWRGDSIRTFAHVRPMLVAALVGLLFATGHYGGSLTHGSAYLFEGFGAGTLASRPAVADPAAAEIYLDVVAPALHGHCSSCHNDEKRRGELSLASYRDLLEGGEGGPVIVPGKAAESDLVRRISLAPDHVDFMPKDGKKPLTPAQRAAIEWWVSIGAPQKGTLEELHAPAAVRQSIRTALGL